MPDGTTFRQYSNKIEDIIGVPDLSNPGSASDLRSGKQLVGADGSIVTGTMPETAGKTVTPTTTAQTAVASGRYVTGDVVVSGDANLKAENIAEGVSIFGVAGTHSGVQIIPITTSNWEITADDNYIKFTFPPGVNESNFIAMGCVLRLAWFDGPNAGEVPDCGATFFLENTTILSGVISLVATKIMEISLGTVISGGDPEEEFEVPVDIMQLFEVDGFTLDIVDFVPGTLLNSLEVVNATGVITVRA